MPLTPEQEAKNKRTNEQMLATQQAKRDARNDLRTPATTSVVTQQEINLAAYKSGKKPEEIQALLQAKGIPPAPTITPVQTIKPSEVTAPAGATYGEANILPPSVTGFSTPKPTIATTDKPVIGTPPATNTPIGDFSKFTPEQNYSKAMEIYTKDPSEVTKEEASFVRSLKFRMDNGEDIYGKKGKSSGTTTYSTELVQPGENIASSTRNADGSYQVTYKDGTSQRTTTEPSTTVFPEGTPEYFVQKKAQENQKQLDVLTQQMNTEAERRKKETADLVAKYGENIASQFQSQKAEIEAQGAKRMEATKSMLAGRGAGRSGIAIEKVDEIAKNIETTITQAKAKADLELMAYRMEQEGADAEAISAMRTNIANVQANIDQANYENQLEIIKLNQENATTGEEAMNNLLSVISNSAEIEEEADLVKSAELGYFINKKGNPMRDSQGRFMEFKVNAQTNLSPEEIEGYYNALKNKVINEKFLDDNLSIGDKNAIIKRAAVQDGSWTGGVGADISQATGDVRQAPGAQQYAGREAWATTNNPSGITVNPGFSKKLDAAGITYSTKPRPSNELGEYYVFSDISDGLKAHNIALKQSGWQDVYQRLYSWSAGGTRDTPQATKEANKKAYAEDLMRQAGIPIGTKFNEITPEQEKKLLSAHIAKESPHLYKVLSGGGTGEKTFSDNQRNVMDNIVGEPTLAQTKELTSAGLNTGDLQKYRQEKRATGDYSTQDLDFIGKIDEKVTKSKVYEDINDSQKFISNLFVTLDRKSAIGDIAAINQFQKIIDEGAVTRDQDVKLIQSAESFLGKMKLLLDKLESGQQLTDNQRREMKEIGKQLLEGKNKIFSNDPGIKALRKQLSSRGIKEDSGIFGEVGVFGDSTTTPAPTGGEGGTTPAQTTPTAPAIQPGSTSGTTTSGVKINIIN